MKKFLLCFLQFFALELAKGGLLDISIPEDRGGFAISREDLSQELSKYLKLRELIDNTGTISQALDRPEDLVINHILEKIRDDSTDFYQLAKYLLVEKLFCIDFPNFMERVDWALASEFVLTQSIAGFRELGDVGNIKKLAQNQASQQCSALKLIANTYQFISTMKKYLIKSDNDEILCELSLCRLKRALIELLVADFYAPVFHRLFAAWNCT